MTTEEVLDAREAAGWVTPISPLEPGDISLLFDQGGIWEILVHPDDALRYLDEGIVVDGRRHSAAIVGTLPLLNAVQLRVRHAE